MEDVKEVGNLLLRKVFPGILGVAVATNFKMKHGPIPFVPSHFGNFFTGRNRLTLGNQSFAVVRVGTEHTVTVLYDNQLTVADQPAAAVNDFTGRGSNNGLPFITGNFDAVPGRIAGFEIAQDSP